MSSSDDSSKSKNKKKKYTKMVSKTLLGLGEFKGWLEVDGNEKRARCVPCCKELKGGKSELKRHAKSNIHIQNIKSASAQKSMEHFVSQTSKVNKLETSICAFITENNLPLSFSEQLVGFIKSLPDTETVQKVQLGKQKTTNIIRQNLRNHFNKNLVETLKKHFFSIFIDETTDLSTEIQMAIVVSYYDTSDQKTKIDVVDIVNLTDSTANGIYTKMMTTLKLNNIPLENWVGFCTDTANVMVGAHHSVAQMVKENYPNVVIIKCSCHSIHLVASYACKMLPYSLEDLVRSIYSHFSRSPKRIDTFSEIQKQFLSDETPLKILSPGQTRWLSLQNCVRRLLKYWEALQHYWLLVLVEDKTHSNDEVLKCLNNPYFKVLLEFLDYSLGLFNDFNTLFQSDAPLFTVLKTKVNTLLKTLAQNFMKTDYVKGTEGLDIDEKRADQYLHLDRLYIGVSATATLATIKQSQDEVFKLKKCIRQFYIESIMQVKKRFQVNESHFSHAECLIPENARSLNPPSLIHFLKIYANHTDIDPIKIDNQWRQQALITNESNDLLEYWAMIFKNPELGELSKFVSIFFSLPFSNATTERVFSCLKNIKTEKRNRLQSESLSGLICTRYGMSRTGQNYHYFMQQGSSITVPTVSNATSKDCRDLRTAK